MAPQGYLVPRTTSSSAISPVYIAGFCVAGALVMVSLVWIGFRWRSKLAKERAAALSKDHGRALDYEKDAQYLPPSVQATNGQASLSIPEKAFTRPHALDRVVRSHADAGSPPQPSSPFQFALAMGGKSPRSSIDSGRSFRPSSIFSFISRRSSSVDGTENRLSTVSSLDQGTSCKVRQIFDPVLPDELVLRLGERVTLVQSFDDGWCVVGRPALAKHDDIEIGAVPTHTFLKPLKGHRPERPMRIDSLGATARLDEPATRQSIISWSKF